MGAKGTVQATWSGLSAGGHFHVERKSCAGNRGMAGAGPVPRAPAQARRARAGDKDNTTKKWQLQKEAAEKKGTREISTVGLRRMKKKKERAVSLFVWTATAEK